MKNYQFKKEDVTGGKRYIGANQFINVGATGRDISRNFIMCPYTDYIPLVYLLCTEDARPRGGSIGWDMRYYLGMPRMGTSVNMNKIGERWGQRNLMKFMRVMYHDKGLIEESLREKIEGWMSADGVVNNILFDYAGYFSYRQRIIEGWGEGDVGVFRQNSYQGAIGPYSLYMGEGADRTSHVLACVLPENYLYVKYHILLHNTIPLDRVVVFVNKELDETSFRPTAFRTLYRELMKDVLSSSAQVWKVPHEFIMEKCFLKAHKLKEKNIIKKKKEQEELVKEFLEGIAYSAPITEPGNLDMAEAISETSRPVAGIWEQLEGANSQEYVYTFNMPSSYGTYTIGADLVRQGADEPATDNSNEAAVYPTDSNGLPVINSDLASIYDGDGDILVGTL